VKLEVRMRCRELTDSPKGFASSDDGAPFMKALFDFLGLTYKKPFTCCCIVPDPEHKKRSPFADRPGVKPRWKPCHAYGSYVFTLNDAAVSKVRIVCAGDFQDVACEVLRQILRGTSLDKVRTSPDAKRLRELPENATPEQVKEALDWASKNKGNWPYAEARLFQAVHGYDGSWA